MMMMMMMVMVLFSVRSFVVLQEYSSVGQPVLLPRVGCNCNGSGGCRSSHR